MSPVLPPRRPIVLKASRDTLVLLAAAGMMTLAIAYSVHNRPAPQEPSVEQAAAGQWTGQLADLTQGQAVVAAPAEPLSSDALTVPKAAMALPVPPKPLLPAKSRTCDGMPCSPAVKAASASTSAAPPRRPAEAAPPVRVREASLVERLNPLNHLPAAVTRPFATAGDTIAGWVKRF